MNIYLSRTLCCVCVLLSFFLLFGCAKLKKKDDVGSAVFYDDAAAASADASGTGVEGYTRGGQAQAALPTAHVWEYLSGFGAEPENYATYSYVLTGRNGGDNYIDLVNYIQGSTASAKEMAESIPPEELNIFLIPALSTADASRKPDHEVSRKLLAVLSARSKLSFDRPGPYIITLYQPISKLKKGTEVDMLYVDLTNISKGAFAEVVRVYKQTVLNKRLNGMDKLYSIRLALLNFAFMTEESIGFAKTAAASLDPVFSGGQK